MRSSPLGSCVRLAQLGLGVFFLMALDCSSSSSSNAAAGALCTGDPSECPEGTTCWPADSTPTLRCLTSSPANGVGATCEQSIGAPTCADGLACDQTSAAAGECERYCGGSGHACPAGYDCRSTNVGGSTGPAIDVCRPADMVLGDDDSGIVYTDDGSFGDDGASYIPESDAQIPGDAGPAHQ